MMFQVRVFGLLLTVEFLVELRHLNTIDGVLLRINKGLAGVITVWIIYV